MNGLCGVNCGKCSFGKNNNCNGCISSDGCPFGKKCFIYDYIKYGSKESYQLFADKLLKEINSLKIPGMPKIYTLSPVNGIYVNLAYTFPNGSTFKILDDNEIYLSCLSECEFNDGDIIRNYRIVANESFILVSEFCANAFNPEIVVYKRR